MKFLFSLILLLLLTSCARVKREELIGTYISNSGIGSIEINSDSTYRYFFTNNNRKYSNKGTWKLNISGDEILFENFSFITDDLPRGNWYSSIRKQDGKIQLIYASDSDVYYEKIYP